MKKQRNYKRKAFGSTPYAFRFSGKTEDTYRQQLDAWIRDAMVTDKELSISQALREVVKGLMNGYLGRSLDVAVEVPQFDIVALRESIKDDLKEWLASQFATPEKAAHLAQVSQSAADGQQIDSDVIANILEDFGR